MYSKPLDSSRIRRSLSNARQTVIQRCAINPRQTVMEQAWRAPHWLQEEAEVI